MVSSMTMETEVVVRWDAPDEPGRTDYYYSVSRSIPGDLTNFQTLNDRLTNTASIVTLPVTNLVPFTNYIIRVSVHNGVSQNDSANDQLRVREVTASTDEGSECFVRNIMYTNYHACDHLSWYLIQHIIFVDWYISNPACGNNN